MSKPASNMQMNEALGAIQQLLEQDQGAADSGAVARHACAIALQDAVDHLRRMETLAAAATARALAQIADGERVEESEKVLIAAQASVTAALETVVEILAKLRPYLSPADLDEDRAASRRSNTKRSKS